MNQSQSTLYNKYRPQTFADVVDQNHVKVTLQNELSQNKTTHAYLFTGARGVGKTTIARLLAKSLNCQQRAGDNNEPCNKCQSCKDIAAGQSLDLVEIDAASQTKVEQTRENIIAASRVSATAGKVKVFIIDEVHMLSSASFNALLKTLEEPPAKVVFILATTEVHKVPETIVSRCQRFDFHRLPVKALTDWLGDICRQEKVEVDKKVLQAIAKQAEGGARDALSLLGQVLVLSDKQITFDQASLVLPRSDLSVVQQLVDNLLAKQSSEAIDNLNKALNEGMDLHQLVKDLLEYLRWAMLYILSGQEKQLIRELDADIRTDLERQCANVTIESLVFMIDILLEKYQQIKYSTIPQLPIEMAFIIICQENDVSSGDNRPLRPKQEQSSASQQPSIEKDSAPPGITKMSVDGTEPASQEPVKKSPVNKSGKPVSLADIESAWKDILAAVREHHQSLAAFLQVARAVSLVNGVLTFGFQYDFHRELLANPANSKVLREIIADQLGAVVDIVAILDEDYDKRQVWEVYLPGNNGGSDDNDDRGTEEIEVDVAAAFG
ncbi:MAG: DNA polymerase III subunit gamma/tau [Candidatus Komeilibacteria bacterium]